MGVARARGFITISGRTGTILRQFSFPFIEVAESSSKKGSATSCKTIDGPENPPVPSSYP
jgi:hypothetical protein